jgi:hypothetical protein
MKEVLKKMAQFYEHKVELGSMQDLIKKAYDYEYKVGHEFYTKFENARAILNDISTMKYDGKYEEELVKLQKEIQDLGLPPQDDLDFAIMNLESLNDVLSQAPSVAKKLDNAFPGVDISGWK